MVKIKGMRTANDEVKAIKEVLIEKGLISDAEITSKIKVKKGV